MSDHRWQSEEMGPGRSWGRAAAVGAALLSMSCAEGPKEELGDVDANLAGPTVRREPTGLDTRGNNDPQVRTVGLLVMANEGSCSGTLVNARTVLTAAHCVCTEGGAVMSPGAVTFQFLAVQSGGAFSSVANAIDVHPKARSRCEAGFFSTDFAEPETWAHDLAVVHLANAVPDSVSGGVYPPVYYGSVPAAWASRIQRGTFRLVGYGSTAAETGEDSGGGDRRSGTNNEIRLLNDECGAFEQVQVDSLLDAPLDMCNDSYTWVAPDHQPSSASFRPGDSGGPLYAPFSVPATMMLVGVVSSHRETLSPTPELHWAPTGDAGGQGNGSWLLEVLEDRDVDADGVLDSTDNCPPHLCVKRKLEPGDCANPDQADNEGDGVGDLCDNCPASACASKPTTSATFECFNSLQLDRDDDGVGDSCDLCPETAAAPGSDPDNDGLGNRCDRCDRVPNARVRCNSGRDCELANAGNKCLEGSFEGSSIRHAVTRRPAGDVLGWCARSPDADGDKLPDDCDNCPNVQNRDQQNTNTLAEDRERLRPGNGGLEKQGDVCDRVPIVRLRQDPEVVDSFGGRPLLGPRGDGQGPEDVAALQLATFRVQEPSQFPEQVDADVALRFCRCVNNSGKQLPMDQCVGEGLGKRCPWNDPTTSTSWTDVSILASDGLSAPSLTPLVSADLVEGVETQPALFHGWNFSRDVALGRIPESPAGCLGAPAASTTVCSAYGALFARLSTQVPIGVSNSVNGRDRDNMLRDNFTLFDIPNIVGVEDTEPFTGLPGPPEWLRPDLRQAIGNLRPMPDPPPFRAPFLDATPVLGRPSDGGHIAVLPGGISAAVGDLTSGLVSADLAAIVAGTRRQIVAVEPGAILRPASAELDGVPQWVSLPTELSPSSLAAPVLWSKAGTMITLSEVVRTDCRPIELAARWESISYPGEIAFPSERTYRVPDRVKVTSGEAVPGGRVELVFERDDFETCRYVEEQGEYRLDVCTNGIVGSALAGDDIVVDAMRLRIIDGAPVPFEVRATIEEQPPCGPVLPPDPRVSVNAAGVTAPLADVPGAPTARTAYAAAYSGLENAVYVVGGVTPEGDTTGPVVRWDLGTNRSRYIAPEAAHAPSDRVLGVAYSPLESVLYVLDVVREVRQVDISGGSDRGGHPSSRSPWWPRRSPHWGHSGHGVHHRPPWHFGGRDVARLYRYDIEKGTSARLATWPYKGLSSGAHLMLLEGGELALVVGRQHHMEAFLFQDAGDHLERRGSLRRHGVLAAPPAMGNHDPVVALLDDGRIEYVTLELSSFRGGERCDDL